MTKRPLAKYKQRKIIPVFFPTDKSYVPILHVAVQSLVSNSSKAYKYHIHILGENLTKEDKLSFSCYNSDNIQMFFTDMEEIIKKHAKKMNIKYYYSKAIYFRTYIPNLFPHYKKILYLDSDIAFNADAAELFNYKLGDNYIGAATCETVATSPVFTKYAENFLGMKLPKYFNSGVLIMNCAALRKINFEDKFYDLMGKVKLELCPDQDAYNILCQGKTVFIPGVWNKIPRPGSKEKLAEIKLVHYNLSLKPWRYDDILYGELFWNYAKDTPVYEKLIEMKRNLPLNIVARDQERMEGLVKLATEMSEVSESINQKIQSGKLVLISTDAVPKTENFKTALANRIDFYRRKIEQALREADACGGDSVLV